MAPNSSDFVSTGTGLRTPIISMSRLCSMGVIPAWVVMVHTSHTMEVLLVLGQ
jgi:hypothetical protein